MQDNARPVKRMKYRACDSCVTSKTRCDDVLPTGCLVCRKRNKQCSLAEIARDTMMRQSTPTTVQFTEESNLELRNRLEIVEARSWELEQRIKSIESARNGFGQTPNYNTGQTPGSMGVQVGSISANGFTPMNEGTAEEMDVDVYLSQIAKRPINVTYDERIYSPVNVKGYPCAIRRGLVSKDQVDMAFHVFKHRFSTILPLSPFLLSSTPTPEHPFVILAILTHVPGFSTPEIHALVEESLSHLNTGAAEQEVLLALLILSLQPFRQKITLNSSPLRLISLAYDIGKSKNLESIVKSAVRHKERLLQPLWYTTLDKVLLWEAIKMQYNQIHLGWTGVDDLLPCHIENLPDHPVDSYNETIQHLKAWSRFFPLIQPFVQALGEAVAEVHYSNIDLDTLFNLWSPIPPRAETLSRLYPQLELPIRSILFTLGLRTTFHVQAIPVPFLPHHKALGNTWIYEQMLRTAFSLIEFFVKVQHPTEIPKHLIMIIVVAISCCDRVMQFYSAANAVPDHVTFTNVPKAMEVIHLIGGIPSIALTKVTAAFHDEPGDLRKRMGVRLEGDDDLEDGKNHSNSVRTESLRNDPANTSMDINDFTNIFNLDFTSWESLLGAYQPQNNGMGQHDPNHGW